MEISIEGTGATTDEAVENALKQLGVENKEDVNIEIVSEGKQGLFGLGNKEAVVKVSKHVPDDLIDAVKEHITKIMEIMGFTADIDIEIMENGVVGIDVSGADLALLIGRKGETLKALQTLVSAFVSNRMKQRLSISLDIEGYKRRRKKQLEELAERISHKVIQTGKSVALQPMSASERRIVHMALSGSEEVTTASEGDEPYRQVLVIPRHKD